jgi:exodeoxyribonuclease VII small subunit
MSDEELGYAEAMAELESILRELEGDRLDVDRLAESVRRAAELIAVCRARIVRAEAEVEGIVTDLTDLELGETAENDGELDEC